MSIHMADFRLITSTTVTAKVSKAVSRSERIIPSASIVVVGAACSGKGVDAAGDDELRELHLVVVVADSGMRLLGD
jgi:hypothetical protein